MSNYKFLQKYAVMAILTLVIVFATEFCFSASTSLVKHFGQVTDNYAGPYECLACHDNIIAKMGDFQMIRLGEKPNPLSSHPINIDYPAELTGDINFANMDEVDAAGLRLLDGKIVCITCHDLRLSSAHFLAVTTDKSKICFVCHRK